jgi:hypothetical protein
MLIYSGCRLIVIRDYVINSVNVIKFVPDYSFIPNVRLSSFASYYQTRIVLRSHKLITLSCFRCIQFVLPSLLHLYSQCSIQMLKRFIFVVSSLFSNFKHFIFVFLVCPRCGWHRPIFFFVAAVNRYLGSNTFPFNKCCFSKKFVYSILTVNVKGCC